MLDLQHKYSISDKNACAPRGDSDQSAHPHGTLRVDKAPKRHQADSEDSDQTARMRRLI